MALLDDLKVDIYSTNELKGGAARAAKRLLRSLEHHTDIKARLLVGIKESNDPLVVCPNTFINTYFKWLPKFDKLITKLQITKNPIFHSTGLFGVVSSGYINSSKADIIHLHWINSGFISIRTINKIKKPIIWTLHDSWAFCGAEHHPWNQDDNRFQNGYNKYNKPKSNIGIDLDRIVWKLKSHYPKSIHIVTPSTWLADQARKSKIFKNFSINVIPNPVDTQVFRPLIKQDIKRSLGLPLDKRIILFGAFGSTFSLPKGGDLLLDALEQLSNQNGNFSEDNLCISIGGGNYGDEYHKGVLIKHYSHIEDDDTLNMLFNASDLVVVPSRIENLPQMATEAIAVGIPVVAFNIGGMPDVVDHEITGYLAQPFDCHDLAHGMQKFLNISDNERAAIQNICRNKAIKLWSNPVVSQQYKSLYESVINENI